MIDAEGAPYPQGFRQGRALSRLIRDEVRRGRSEMGRLAWRRRLRDVARGPALRTARFLPQHRERLSGIADGAGVPLAALDLLEATQRLALETARDGRGLLVAGELPGELADALLLRASRPDVGGFASLELTRAAWAGSLAGVNAEGIAVVCAGDRDRLVPSARLLVQELLLRTRELAAAVDHARRRGRYVGDGWSLVVADRSGDVARIDAVDGAFRVSSEVPDKLPDRGAVPGASERVAIRAHIDPGVARIRATVAGRHADREIRSLEGTL